MCMDIRVWWHTYTYTHTIYMLHVYTPPHTHVQRVTIIKVQWAPSDNGDLAWKHHPLPAQPHWPWVHFLKLNVAGLRPLTLLFFPPGTLFSPYSHMAQPEIRCKIVNNWNAFGKQPVGPNIWATGRMLDENPRFCRGATSRNASCGAHASFRSGLKHHLLRRYSLTAQFKIGSLPSPCHPTVFSSCSLYHYLATNTYLSHFLLPTFLTGMWVPRGKGPAYSSQGCLHLLKPIVNS